MQNITKGARSVAAVVVTFNRLALLQVCVESLRNQSEPLTDIIVVNNNSTDGTTEWLASQPDLITINQENKGGAAGFYTGIKMATDNGYAWAWCMDDDGVPDRDALRLLLRHEDRKPCVMNALVLDIKNTNNMVFDTGGYTRADQIREPVIEGVANLFNGTLIHTDIVRQVGLPIKELTIWGDESEYLNRILHKYRLPLFTVAASHHYHPAQSGVFYKKEWDVDTDWKVYYFIRNKYFTFRSRYRTNFRALIAYISFIAGFAATILFYQKKKKLTKLRLLLLGFRHGIARNLSAGIPDVKRILQRLNGIPA